MKEVFGSDLRRKFMGEFKCLKCIYYNEDGYKLNGYGEKLPDTCLTGSQYYCVISGYSLFKKKK